jgi:hypothetical protein
MGVGAVSDRIEPPVAAPTHPQPCCGTSDATSSKNALIREAAFFGTLLASS